MVVENRERYEQYLVDWNGDGQFDHNLSDVTRYVVNISYEYGMNVLANRGGPTWGLGKGRIKLTNRDGIFSVDVRGGVEDANLTRPRKFKHVIDGIDQYIGLLEPVSSTTREGSRTVSGEIVSPYKYLTSEDVVFSTNRLDGDTVETVNTAVFQQLGIPSAANVYNEWYLAPGVSFECRLSEFWNAMTRFSDSYLIEGHEGTMRWHSPHIQTSPIRVVRDANTAIIRNTAYIDRRAELSRNRVYARYLTEKWDYLDVLNGQAFLPDGVDVGEPQVYTNPDVLRYSGIAGYVGTLHKYGTRRNPPPTAKRLARIIVDGVFDNSIAWHVERIIYPDDVEKPDIFCDFHMEGFVISHSGIVNRYVNDLPAQEEYTQRPIENMPAWFWLDDDIGLTQMIWRRRTPQRVGVLEFPVHQQDDIFRVHAGDVVHATVTQNGITYSSDFLVGRKYYSRRQGAKKSRITWHVIELPDIPVYDYNAELSFDPDAPDAARVGYMRLHDPAPPTPVAANEIIWRSDDVDWLGEDLTWR